MKKILMFDDFLMTRTDNTRRRFHQPDWRYGEPFLDPASPRGVQGLAVVPAPQGGWYMTYYILPGGDTASLDEDLRIGMAYSGDGNSWAPYEKARPGHPGGSHVLGLNSQRIGSFLYFDAAEENPVRRYKAVCVPYGNGPRGPVEEAPLILVSPDALHWETLNEARLVPGYVDCAVSLLRNQTTGRFQATTRRRWGERRICLVESADLAAWTPPRAVLHPLPTDEPTTHLYGMPQFYYRSGDLFLGMLWRQIMPYDKVMEGPMRTEYAYSYDGLGWNRTFADAATPRGYGTTGGGGSFVFSMIELGEDLLFHANAFLYEHGGLPRDGKAPDAVPGRCIVAGRLKKDRIVGIESGKGSAEMATQNLKLRKPELRLNVNAPFASVRAEIRRDGRPVEGFTYEDCRPIEGDHPSCPLEWKGGSLGRFCGENQWIRLHVRMEQAELFAVEGDFAFTINTRAPDYDRL